MSSAALLALASSPAPAVVNSAGAAQAPGDSTAYWSMIAAWFLAIANFAAFATAAVAARYAWRTFVLETKVQLGQSQCLKHDKVSADVVRYLQDDGKLTKEQPAGFDPAQYHRHEHALTALGRASIIEATVDVSFRFRDDEEHFSSPIDLGHIQPHAETHVRIYTHPRHDNPFVVWRNARHQGVELPEKRAFFPMKPSNGRVVKEVGNLFRQDSLNDSFWRWIRERCRLS